MNQSAVTSRKSPSRRILVSAGVLLVAVVVASLLSSVFRSDEESQADKAGEVGNSSTAGGNTSPAPPRPRFEGSAGFLRDLSYRMDVGDVAFDPSMTRSSEIRFAVGFDQGEVRRYYTAADTLQTRAVRYLDGDVPVTAISYSLDGALLASGDASGVIRVRDAQAEKLTPPSMTLRGHDGQIDVLGFNADHTLLLSGSSQDRTVRLWDLTQRNQIDRLIASSRSDVTIHEAGNGLSHLIVGAQLDAGAVGGLLVSGDTPMFVDIDRRTLRTRQVSRPETLTPGLSDGVGRWRQGESEPFELIWSDVSVCGISADGRIVVASLNDGSLVRWDLTRVDLADTIIDVQAPPTSRKIRGVFVSPQGQYAVTYVDRRHLQIWRLPLTISTRRLKSYNLKEPIHAAAISPDGQIIVAGTSARIHRWDFDAYNDRSWEKYDSNSIHVQPPTTTLPEPTVGLAFTPNGAEVAYVSPTPETASPWVRIWRLDDSGRRGLKPVAGLRHFEAHTDAITGVGFLNGTLQLATCSRDETLRIWSTETALETAQHALGTAPTGLAISPDGRRILVATETSDLRLFDVDRLKEVERQIQLPTTGRSVHWSHDGFVVAGHDDGTVHVWDAETWQPTAKLQGHTDRVTGVVSWNWGRYVLSGSEDRTVRLWDADAQEELSRFVGHGAAVTAVDVDPYGSRGVSAGLDGIIHVWDVDAAVRGDR